MLERTRTFFETRELAVILPNGTVIAFMRLADIKDICTIALTLLTFAYTVWIWRHNRKR